MSNVIHDLVKIQLSREGYLPDYPPHLISDAEMCSAFLVPDGSARRRPCKFLDFYPRPEEDGVSEEVDQAYTDLVDSIETALNDYLASEDPDAELPNWVYSYMLGIPVGPNNNEVDRHNALVTIGMDNVYDEMTPQVYARCLETSKRWLAKYGVSDRAPTIFIEPHVIKYFRLLNAI